MLLLYLVKQGKNYDVLVSVLIGFKHNYALVLIYVAININYTCNFMFLDVAFVLNKIIIKNCKSDLVLLKIRNKVA